LYTPELLSCGYMNPGTLFVNEKKDKFLVERIYRQKIITGEIIIFLPIIYLIIELHNGICPLI